MAKYYLNKRGYKSEYKYTKPRLFLHSYPPLFTKFLVRHLFLFIKMKRDVGML